MGVELVLHHVQHRRPPHVRRLHQGELATTVHDVTPKGSVAPVLIVICDNIMNRVFVQTDGAVHSGSV